MTEEVDCRFLLHIVKAGEEHFNIILLLSNDTDVVIYNLAYYGEFRRVTIVLVFHPLYRLFKLSCIYTIFAYFSVILLLTFRK